MVQSSHEDGYAFALRWQTTPSHRWRPGLHRRVKIINFELYKQAFAARGIHLTTLEIEHDGLPLLLAKHGLTEASLGVRGVTLYYRREKTAMPLASPPDNATPQQLEKNQQVRAKLMDKVIEKYLVKFVPNHAPLAPLVEDGRMVGVRFQRTRTVDGKLVSLPGETVDVRSPMVVSAVGSIPLPLPGLPMKGELIDFADWSTGRVRGLPHVFGLGKCLPSRATSRIVQERAELTRSGAELPRFRCDAPSRAI